MKVRIKKSTTLLSSCLMTIGLLVLGVVLANAAKPAYAQVEGGRLITVHDRGTQTTFVTTKQTLREALADHQIPVEDKDAVEPGIDEKLVAPDYQVNIYRARPITVVDGVSRHRVVTPYQSAERIAKDAGVQLYPEDTLQLERSTDVLTDGAGLRLIITRATAVSVDLYGTPTTLRTQARTVGDMLKEKNITLGQDGRVSVDLSAPITSGMQLRVWREGKQTINVEEAVAYETEQVKDADREVGYKEVQTAGQNGKRTVTYEVEIQNGAEVARTEIASIVTQAAVKQVEIIGAKPKTLAYNGGGSKTDWLAASNIPAESWGYADFMIQKESGWNPNSLNKSSGACGLAQALPCSKLGPNWNDPVVALNWMHGYVTGRYGGWEQAYNFWVKNRWY